MHIFYVFFTSTIIIGRIGRVLSAYNDDLSRVPGDILSDCEQTTITNTPVKGNAIMVVGNISSWQSCAMYCCKFSAFDACNTITYYSSSLDCQLYSCGKTSMMTNPCSLGRRQTGVKSMFLKRRPTAPTYKPSAQDALDDLRNHTNKTADPHQYYHYLYTLLNNYTDHQVLFSISLYNDTLEAVFVICSVTSVVLMLVFTMVCAAMLAGYDTPANHLSAITDGFG